MSELWKQRRSVVMYRFEYLPALIKFDACKGLKVLCARCVVGVGVVAAVRRKKKKDQV